MFDVVIIGAGVIGGMIARTLSAKPTTSEYKPVTLPIVAPLTNGR